MPSKELTRLLGLGEYQVVCIEEETDDEVTLFIEPVHPSPFCSGCGQACLLVHSTEERKVRHLDAFHRRCFLRFDVRFVRCPHCGLKAEVNELVEARKRSTKAGASGQAGGTRAGGTRAGGGQGGGGQGGRSGGGKSGGSSGGSEGKAGG